MALKDNERPNNTQWHPDVWELQEARVVLRSGEHVIQSNTFFLELFNGRPVCGWPKCQRTGVCKGHSLTYRVLPARVAEVGRVQLAFAGRAYPQQSGMFDRLVGPQAEGVHG